MKKLIVCLILLASLTQAQSVMLLFGSDGVASIDTIPSQFTFADVTDAAVSSYNQGYIVVAGCDSARFYPASGDTIRVGALGTKTVSPVWVDNGDTVYTFCVASGTNSTTTRSIVYSANGTPVDSFNVTTVAATGATPFYTLDFEEGDLTDWTSTTGAGVSATTGSKYAGTYGMNVTSTSTYGVKTFTARDSVYVTFQFYMPDATTCTDGYAFCGYFAESSGGDRTMWGGNANVDTTKWVEWIGGRNSGNMVVSTANFTRGAWHEVKMFYKKGTGANSIHRIWVDGDSILNVTDGAYTDQVDRFLFGIQSETLTGNMYIDDIKLYDESPD